MSARSKRILIGVAVLAMLLAMVHVVGSHDLLGLGGSGLPDTFRYSDEDQRVIDPKLLLYSEVRAVPTGMNAPRDLAVGPTGHWYIVGDRGVRILSPDGSLVGEFEVPGQPRCIAVSDDGQTIALGVGAKVMLYAPTGEIQADWAPVREGGTICGIDIDLDSNSVYVAEYVSRTVVRYDLAGKELVALGQKQPQGYPGIKAPSPYISVNVGRGLVWINNPGHLRIEAHSPRGEFQHAWGHDLKDPKDISAFPGCCNPCDFALLPGRRFVTFEKGKNYETVKVFQEGGILEAVVATPDAFKPGTRGVAVDVAATGELLVMDPARKTIRVFQENP